MGETSKGYTNKKVLAAIRESGGIVSTIARRLGCDWHTAKKLINKWENTTEAYNDERELILDMSETAILKSVKEGNTQDAKWLLSSLAKHRGYGIDSLSIQNPDGSGIFEVFKDKKTSELTQTGELKDTPL